MPLGVRQLPNSRFVSPLCAAWVLFVAGAAWGADGVPVAIRVSPASVLIDGPEQTQQLLVTAVDASGATWDATRACQFSFANPAFATVDERGRVAPLADGATTLEVSHHGQKASLPVETRAFSQPRLVSFSHDVEPLLTKAGCNAGGCHGKAGGQNGFALSVFGFDVAADYRSLMMEGRGRRVFAAAPEHSLLLRKAIAVSPHGGGRRMGPESLSYRMILRWIQEGARESVDDESPTTAIEVEPASLVIRAGVEQQLRVTAIDALGRKRCVTAAAEFSSSAPPIADVDAAGLVSAGDVPGEAAILIRYQGQVAVARFTLPRSGAPFTRPLEHNFIDKLVWDRLERLGIPASESASDATFLRRVFVDLTGSLPTTAEAREFLGSTQPDKRARLIDALLQRPEYADYWTQRWADILRVDRDAITPQGAVAMHRWLRRQFAENRPYDQFVREIVLAEGDTTADGPAAFYKALNTPELAARGVSQLFLGVRIECAQCHHHPFERWSQDDYFALAGFFSGVNRKPLPGGVESILAGPGVDLKHPRTGQLVPTRALGAPAVEFDALGDRRRALADWMVARDNPFVVPSIVNRLWGHYFGRGLVDPIDDMRATNPATNEPLLAALVAHFKELNYDLRAFTRTLLQSRVYQLSSETNDGNVDDTQNFSHMAVKPLAAEVLLDAISQATGVPEKFTAWPEGYRAVQVWDNRMPSYFFQIFGRPVRASVCECERSSEPSVAQALHLLNSPEIAARIASRLGTARRLADAELSAGGRLDEMFLSTLSRYPSDAEKTLLVGALDVPREKRRAAVEDVLWALLNSKEFLLNR